MLEKLNSKTRTRGGCLSPQKLFVIELLDDWLQVLDRGDGSKPPECCGAVKLVLQGRPCRLFPMCCRAINLVLQGRLYRPFPYAVEL